jgi:NAD+ dependent glucose-6-phosphate dehydrogenase
VITGGAGRIATALRPFLRPTRCLRLVDTRPLDEPLVGDEEFCQASVSDLQAMTDVCQGAVAVLHLAANPSTSATWAEMHSANIDGTYNVYAAARRAGVRKIVFASSNHAMGFANLAGERPIVDVGEARPDSLYGVSKAFGEALGRYFSDAFDMSIICLRIGWFTPRQPTALAHQPLWVSARDLAQVVQLALETPRMFGVYNVTSNNAQRHWDLSRTRAELGYAPQDDVTTLDLPVTDADRNARYCDPPAGVLRAEPS